MINEGVANNVAGNVRAFRRAQGLAQLTDGAIVVRHDEITPTDLGSRVIRRLVDEETTQILRLDQVTMRAGQSYQDAGEQPGISIRILVLAGSLRCGPLPSLVELATGDLAAFSGSRPHQYEAAADGARFLRLSCRTAQDISIR